MLLEVLPCRGSSSHSPPTSEECASVVFFMPWLPEHGRLRWRRPRRRQTGDCEDGRLPRGEAEGPAGPAGRRPPKGRLAPPQTDAMQHHFFFFDPLWMQICAFLPPPRPTAAPSRVPVVLRGLFLMEHRRKGARGRKDARLHASWPLTRFERAPGSVGANLRSSLFYCLIVTRSFSFWVLDLMKLAR